MSVEPNSDDMRNAMVQVAEEATYVFMDESGANVNWPDEVLTAHIEVHEPYVGELILVASPDWACRLAASFEGCDDESGVVSDKKRNDAFCEMLNMMCGIFIGAGGKNTAEPSFGIPHVKTTGRETLDNLFAVASRCVVLEADSGDRMALLFVHKERPAS